MYVCDNVIAHIHAASYDTSICRGNSINKSPPPPSFHPLTPFPCFLLPLLPRRIIRQLLCTQCHSFSAHLFEQLGNELGPFDGMTLKQEYCDALIDACDGQIAFGGQAEYGESYCDKHVGGGDDLYWSYPYTDRKWIGWDVYAVDAAEPMAIARASIEFFSL